MKPLTLCLALLLPVLCLAGYLDLLSIGWAGQDSITAVESSRFSGPGEMFRLFERALMQDTGFIFTYYRPITALSFGLNYLLCGAGAFGYHLVVLAILAGICLCVFFLGLFMPRRPAHPVYLRLSAFVAAILFGMHTVNLTVLPVVARRSEGQLVLFGALGLLFTVLACRRVGMARVVHGCLAFVLLALSTLSKEAGILFYPPALLIAVSYLRSPSRKRNLITLLGAGALIGFLGFGLMLLRGSVINIPASHSIHMSMEGAFKTAWNYLLTLSYPVRFMGLDGPFAGRWFPALLAASSVLALGWALIFVLVPERRILRMLTWIAGWILSLGFVICLLAGAGNIPFDASAAPEAIWTGGALSTGPVLTMACAMLGLLTAAAVIKRLVARGEGAEPSDMVVVLSTWLFCAWFVVTITGLYSYRNSMGPAIAFLLLLLLAFDRLIATLRAPSTNAVKVLAGGLASALVLTGLSIAVFSHPVQRYREWKDLDRIASFYLEDVIAAALEDGLEGISEIDMEGVPGMCFFKDRYEKCVALARYTDYTMRSWFKLRLPGAPPVRQVRLRRLKNPLERVRVTARRDGSRLILTGVYTSQ